MIRSRFLRLASSALLRRSRPSLHNSRPSLHSSMLSPHSTQCRSYTKGPYQRDQKLAKQFAEEDSSLHSRPWANYVIPSVAVLGIAGVGMFIKYNDEKRAIPKGSHKDCASEIKCNKPAIGGPFELYDTENNVVTDRDLRGNWVLMYFGYTSSPDLGPEEVQKMAKAIKILESEHNIKLKPVFVTIDPQRDTPDQLRAYLQEFDPRILGLTGPIGAVRQMAQEYRVFFKKVDEEGQDYLVECSHNMYLLDPNLEIARIFGAEYDASQLVNEIIEEVKKPSK